MFTCTSDDEKTKKKHNNINLKMKGKCAKKFLPDNN